jgi:hypothetical protein
MNQVLSVVLYQLLLYVCNIFLKCSISNILTHFGFTGCKYIQFDSIQFNYLTKKLSNQTTNCTCTTSAMGKFSNKVSKCSACK